MGDGLGKLPCWSSYIQVQRNKPPPLFIYLLFFVSLIGFIFLKRFDPILRESHYVDLQLQRDKWDYREYRAICVAFGVLSSNLYFPVDAEGLIRRFVFSSCCFWWLKHIALTKFGHKPPPLFMKKWHCLVYTSWN